MANGTRRQQILQQPLGGPGFSGIPAAYGLPIVTTYSPTTADQGDFIGQIWADTVDGTAFVLAAQSGGTSTWASVSSGAGTFSSVTVNGAGPGALTVTSLGTGVIFSNAGVFNSQALNNGQLMIGSTGQPPVAATLLAGTGIGIVNGAGSITISAQNLIGTWTPETASFNAAVENGYVITAGSGTVNCTLPTVAALGNTVEVIYPSATAADILEVTATAGKLRMPGDDTGRTHYTWPDCSFSGADNPSFTVVCTTASATVPTWTLTAVNGSPTGS